MNDQGFENPPLAGEIENPGFINPIGPDGYYGTDDDDYTLNGNNINDGEDLDQCFDIPVQGKNYHICYSDALDPSTDWTTTPPTVYTLSQNDYGSWERGAYVYTGGASPTCSSQGYYCCPSGSTCSSPITGSGCSGTCCASSSQCTVMPYCGDGTCNGSETATTCCQDCGGCQPGQNFLPGVPVEAESGALAYPMQTGSNPQASGGSYIHTATGEQGSAIYTFDITTPGDYIMEARVIAPDIASDSFYVGLDSEPAQGDNSYSWDTIKTSSWEWTNVSLRGSGTTEENEFNPMVWTLTSGQHTFTLYGRDYGTLLDQIKLVPLSGTQDTCQSLGYQCCSACSPGTSHSAYDDDCPGVCCGNCYSGQPTTEIEIEAESGTLTSPMVAESDPQASGGQYIHTTSSDNGTATYQFDITSPGKYVIEARVIAPDEGSDSFFAGIDSEAAQGNPYYVWDTPEPTSWAWINVSRRGTGTPDANEFDPMVWDLSAGTHTLNIYGREGGTLLDKMVLRGISLHRADTSGDGCVDQAELMAFIGHWYQDSTTYPMGEVMEAVALWYAGCP